MSAVSQLLASRTSDNHEQETIQSIIHATREDEVCIKIQLTRKSIADET